MFEFTREVLSYELNFWENRNKFKVAKDHIAELNQVITLLEKADNLIKENTELKQVIAHSDGIQMQNEDLIRENDRLKKQLDFSKDRIIEILKSWRVQADIGESKLKQFFDCEDDITPEMVHEQIANEILESK